MRHHSSIISLAKTLYTFSKSSLSMYKFGEISPEQFESLKFCNVVGSFCKNHIKFSKKSTEDLSPMTFDWIRLSKAYKYLDEKVQKSYVP